MHDARIDQPAHAQVLSAAGHDDDASDPLALIDLLAQNEIALIHEVLDIRFSGGHVSPERSAALRQAHRRGLAARQRCGDRSLDAEFRWLQGYGSYALMADLSEFDRSAFEHDLDHRATELRRALVLLRKQTNGEAPPPPAARQVAEHDG